MFTPRSLQHSLTPLSSPLPVQHYVSSGGMEWWHALCSQKSAKRQSTAERQHSRHHRGFLFTYLVIQIKGTTPTATSKPPTLGASIHYHTVCIHSSSLTMTQKTSAIYGAHLVSSSLFYTKRFALLPRHSQRWRHCHRNLKRYDR